MTASIFTASPSTVAPPPHFVESSPPPLPRPDIDGLARALRALGAEAAAAVGPEDVAHFQKLVRWGRTASALGYATAWIAPNPVSAVLLSLGSTARWTIVAHHVLHGAFREAAEAPASLGPKRFASGWRRFVDWLDWMHPDAWSHEHNLLHHYRLGEVEDPDLLEERAAFMRDGKMPMALRYLVVAANAATWKWSYYSQRTFHAWWLEKRARTERTGTPPGDEAADDTRDAEAARERDDYRRVLDPRTDEGRAFFASVAPVLLVRYGLVPLAFSVLGPWAALSVLANTAMAEVLTNVHTFLVVVPNHAGDDLERYDRKPRGRAEFYLRQILGSTNFRTGGDVNDFLHGFLNYQIEHHLYPDLPPLQYQRIQPRVKALCEEHGVPYTQESVWKRARRMVDIAVGKTSMKRG